MFSAIRSRDLGQPKESAQSFRSKVLNSISLIERLERVRTLEGHAGCVNTVGFSGCGNLLISGSDDKRIVIWNWFTGQQVLSYRSGHLNNIFQARFLPQTNNSTVVTCAADGQVRVGYLHRSDQNKASTSSLATHGSRAHKLALDPQTPQCFYSCGEDGRVFHYDLRCSNARQCLLVCNKGSTEDRFVVGGSDIFARVYDQRRSLVSTSSYSLSTSTAAAMAVPIRMLAPKSLRQQSKQFCSQEMACHITCANFSKRGEILATYNDENIHLFASEGPAVGRAASLPEASSLRKRSSKQCGITDGPAVETCSGGSSDASRQPNIRARTGLRISQDVGNSPDSHNPGLGGPSANAACTPREVPSPERLSTAPQRLSQNRPDTGDDPASRDCNGEGSAGEVPPEAGVGGPAVDGIAEVPRASQSHSGCKGASSRSSGDEEQPGHSGAGVGWMSDSGLSLSYDDDPHGSSSSSGPRSDESSSEESESDLEEEDSSEADVGAVIMNSAAREAFLNEPEEAAHPSNLVEEDEKIDDEVLMTYTGHRNNQTVKGVSFLGDDDEYVMSGSDDGHIYIWSRTDGILRQWLRGDTHIVNCLEPHPHQPLAFATSGIDNDIKVWAPTAPERSKIPEKAWPVIYRNKKAQGPRRIPAASARRILLRLHHLAQSREDAGVFDEDADNEDSPSYTPGDCVIA